MKLPQSSIKARVALARQWERWRLIVVPAAIVLVVVVGAAVAVDTVKEGMGQARRSAVEEAVSGLATDLSAAFQQRFRRYEQLGDEDALTALLAAGERDALRDRARELAARAPELLRVRLLPAGEQQVDYTTEPPLTYASLDMMQRAEQGERPAREVQLFGTEDEHVAALRTLAGPEGGVAGHALFALSVDLIPQVLDQVPFPGGYAEIRQLAPKAPPLILARRGEPQAGEPLSRALPGTAWALSYQPVSAAKPGEGIGLWVWGVAAALILALAVVVGLLMMRRRAAGKPVGPFFGGALGKLAAGSRGSTPEMVKDYLSQEDEHPPAPRQDEDITAVVAGPEPEEPVQAQQPGAEGGVPQAIFRAYDIRGIAGSSLTVDHARLIGQAIGSEAYERGQQTMVVGRDGRSSSAELSSALIEGLRESGRDVIDVGQIPTPVLYFATHFLETYSGVMVTGSHNPPEYNGFKVVLGGKSLAEGEITALHARIASGELQMGEGSLQSMDIGAEYIRRVSEDVPVALGSAYKLVVDCANGVAGELAPRLYRALGHDVVELFCEIDGRFPNHHPDPMQPANLQALIQAVGENQADLGLAFDGDGDRLVVVDGQGKVVWPDRLMMLFARDVLSREQGAEIIYDVKCTNLLGKVIAKLGGKPSMWKSGHSLLRTRLQDSGAALAGEYSGHIFLKDRWYGFDDALYAGARLLEILQGIEGTPAQIFAKLPAALSTPELRVEMPEGEHHRFMQRLQPEQAFADAQINTLDGVRVDYPDGWGLVRASNTVPGLMMRFEGSDEEALKRVQEAFRKALLAVDPKLELPF